MTDLYLDYNGSTPVLPEAARAALELMTRDWGNPGAAHPSGRAARAAIDATRALVARRLGARPEEILFTSGGTESNNHALVGSLIGREGAHVVTSAVEHPSVLRTLEALERRGVAVTRVAPRPDGALRVEDVRAALTPATVLVSLMVANNETGVLQPVEQVGELCRERGVRYHVDAVCSFGKLEHDVQRIGCDLLSMSSHKLYAPKGVGVLYVREGVELEPLIHGCGQQAGRRSGTENAPGVAALGEALTFLERQAERVRALAELREALWEGLAARFDVRRNGTAPGLVNTLNVAFPGHDALWLQERLGERGLCVSAGASSGSGAPSHVLCAMGLPPEHACSSLRFSLGLHSTSETLEALFDALEATLAPADAVSPRSSPASPTR